MNSKTCPHYEKTFMKKGMLTISKKLQTKIIFTIWQKISQYLKISWFQIKCLWIQNMLVESKKMRIENTHKIKKHPWIWEVKEYSWFWKYSKSNYVHQIDKVLLSHIHIN